MYPAAFEYHRAKSVEDAVLLLQRYQDEAKLIAGGHSLVPLMKLRFAQPRHLIDVRRIPGLAGVREEGDTAVVGALTTYAEIIASDAVRRRVPVLAEAAAQVGDQQVRNLGTLGGSLAHADPAADMPAVVLALGATLVAAGPGGERRIQADDFFQGMFFSALEAQEVLTEVRISSLPAGTGAAYHKQPHPASGYALCGAAAVVARDARGRIERARVAFTGVTTHAVRATAMEQALVGSPGDADSIVRATERALEGLPLRGDAVGAEGYNLNLARVCAQRAVQRAAERARG